MKKFAKAALAVVAILAAVFLMGRYGWKLAGFRACQSAGVESVEVSPGAVRLQGFYPGSFPQGFCGCYAEEEDGRLYVGFRFSAVFGFFETGRFDVTVPVRGEIREVWIRTAQDEYPIWNAADGAGGQSAQQGVYVRLEPEGIGSVRLTWAEQEQVLQTAGMAWEDGTYLYLGGGIAAAAQASDGPVPYTLAALGPDGSVVAQGDFVYDAAAEKQYLAVTADGQVVDETAGRVPAPAETPAAPAAYAVVLGEYHTALAEGWDAARVMEQGLNYMVADGAFAAPLEEIGYQIADLDGDGVQELLIGSRTEDDFYGRLVFSLYTLDPDGAPLLLFDSTERNRYYYAGGVRFANLGASDWNTSFVTTLKLEDRELVDMTYTTDPADYVQPALTPFAQWTE